MYSIGDSKKGEIEIIQPRRIFANQYVEIFDDIVRFPAGNVGTYIRVNNATSKSVGVLPITRDGRLVVIRNYRHGARGWGIEIPKGAVDPGESAEQAAARELEEETGYVCRKLIHAGEYSESPAIYSSKIDCFFALDCSYTHSPHSENTEAIEKAMEISLDDFLARRYEADFIDALSEMMAYQYLHRKEALEI